MIYNFLSSHKTSCIMLVRHPAIIASSEVRAFLEPLAVERHVAAATQNQALKLG
ncbi:hypothetical protein EKK97_06555 [Billgrantia tianxiuensis]|uniref:Integrase SAM-like N-terminal domain-containing protein n=1 Tax=Billgrantia tianxiuensis TaxID=2497861 RepID=A0A6I6SIM0_9GAMM|nr:hypothetical protein [Halomonas sp. MCCC 1A11057]QHC49342.1 hypothetical protein EKK97_06555 [Halomonas tianxiuensis]